MTLRNCILIALATDATPEEYEHAHSVIDLLQQGSGTSGVDPAYLVNQSVAGTVNGVNALGNTTPGAAPAAAGNNSSHGSTLDAAGLPWDERIHSSNKKLNDKGTWWAKRGVTPALKSQVEAELRATVGAAPATSAPPVQQPANSAPPMPGAGGPPMPGANLPPMPGAAVIDPAYAALVAFIGANTASTANPAGKLNDDYVQKILAHFGVAEGSLQNLAHRPDLVPTVQNWLTSVVNGTAQ